MLWDCISLIDDRSVNAVQALGGVSAIAISHPHYYSSMIEWSRALGDVPVYLHAADGEWVMRPHPAIVFWHGETHELAPGPHPDSLRRSFRRRHRAALGRRRRRAKARC